MELDSRIKEGKRPLTCFDTEQAKEFLGKECYFSNCKSHYKNLSAFEKFVSLTDYCIGELTAIMDLGIGYLTLINNVLNLGTVSLANG